MVHVGAQLLTDLIQVLRTIRRAFVPRVLLLGGWRLGLLETTLGGRLRTLEATLFKNQ